MFQKMFPRLIRARRLRSGMIVLCAIGAIVLVAVGASPLLALGTVTMRVDPATRAVSVNGTFTVDIVADLETEMDPNGLGAYEFDLVYDKDYLEVVTDGVTDAGELGATGRTVAELGPSVDNENGRTMFAAYSHPPEDVSGPGDTVVLATATLRAKRAGVTALNLENALMADTQANAWPDEGERELNVSSGMVWNIIDAFSYCVFESGPGTHFDCVDFDGDQKADPVTYDPDAMLFRWKKSGSSYAVERMWLKPANSIPLVGDFDGDGKADPATYDPDEMLFRWKKSGSGYTIERMWLKPANAIPLVGDFDGDGKADPATYEPDEMLFRWKKSGSGYTIERMWLKPANAIQLVGDFDGDGKVDPATYEPDEMLFRWKKSGSGYTVERMWLKPADGIPVN
jgi:hypothetical protein